MNKSIPVIGTHNYFIQKNGRVFKIVREREVTVRPHLSGKTLFVTINSKEINYLNLMIQHFKPDLKLTDKIKFKVSKHGLISAGSIVIKPFTNSVLTPEEENDIIIFCCEQKAASANARGKGIITALQVYTSLKINNFQCIYCKTDIKGNDWHLDHYYPLSQYGKNKFENIVPSCQQCNMMKGTFQPHEFYKKCIEICFNFKYYEDMGSCIQSPTSTKYKSPIRNMMNIRPDLEKNYPHMFKRDNNG